MEQQYFKKVPIQQLQPRQQPQSNKYGGYQLWGEYGAQHLLTYEQNCRATLSATFDNGFYSAFLYAYDNHGDIKIKPDEVWIVIMLYFSKYVNDNAEKLRNAFVSHQGKKELIVKTEQQLQQTQWDEFFTKMIEEIKKNTTKGVTEKLQCDFTTTKRFERLISTSIIMNTYQKYFSYGRCVPDCGIRNVHFGGTLDDWKKLLQKTQILKDYDVNGALKYYVGKVSAILHKFIDTYQENVDVSFWNKVMNVKSSAFSGSTTEISGWIIDFFGFDGFAEQVTVQSIGFDITIDNHLTGIKKKVRMVGGFKAVSNQGHIYRPHLSFAIQDQKGKRSNNREKSSCKYW